MTHAEWELQSMDSCRLRTTTQKLRAIVDEFTRKNLAIPADILAEIKELRKESKSRNNRGRGLWQAFCHGFGVTKAEVDKLLKD